MRRIGVLYLLKDRYRAVFGLHEPVHEAVYGNKEGRLMPERPTLFICPCDRCTRYRRGVRYRRRQSLPRRFLRWFAYRWTQAGVTVKAWAWWLVEDPTTYAARAVYGVCIAVLVWLWIVKVER